mgnify:FL=1
MNIYRILIVEDDLDMQEMMVSFLQKSGFMVSAVKNAVELSDQLKSQRIDLVLLDVMLGDDNGIKLCKNIRENNNIPIIIVSALSADQDRLLGL